VARWRRVPSSGAHRPVAATGCCFQFPSGCASRAMFLRLYSRGPVAPARKFSAQAAGVHVSPHALITERIWVGFAPHIYLPNKVCCGKHLTRHPAASAPGRSVPIQATIAKSGAGRGGEAGSEKSASGAHLVDRNKLSESCEPPGVSFIHKLLVSGVEEALRYASQRAK